MSKKPGWLSRLFGGGGPPSANLPPSPLHSELPTQAAGDVLRTGPSPLPLATTPWLSPIGVPNTRSQWSEGRRSVPVGPEDVPAELRVGEAFYDRYHQPGSKELLCVYSVEGLLGEGGMGKVYKVRHLGLMADMAVKCPKLEIFQHPNGKENFVREATAWVNLGSHAHIVGCLNVQTLGGIPRVFAEYVEGGSLKDWISNRKLYAGGSEKALDRILDIAIQFAWGLHYAHEQGLVHQDVKPANVMMTVDGTAKVTDFGLAKARAAAGEARTTKPGTSILVSAGGMTPAYCSPEQASGKLLSHKTDIWSWGVSILEMFSGGVTWLGGQAAAEALQGQLEMPPGEEGIPRMPQALADLLKQCFAYQPDDRPDDFREIVDTLRALYEWTTGHAYARQQPGVAGPTAKRLDEDGRSLVMLGLLDEAIAKFHQALVLEPDNAVAHSNLGIALSLKGDLERALAEGREAVRLDPDRPLHRLGLGRMLREKGELNGAIGQFREAVRLAPRFEVVREELARALLEKGDMDAAISELRELVRLDPLSSKRRNNLGLTLLRRGEVDGAIAEFREVARLEPDFVAAHNDLGAALCQKGDAGGGLASYAEAIESFDCALTLKPRDPTILRNKTYALMKLGRHGCALPLIDIYLSEVPGDSPAHISKIQCLAALLLFREAVDLAAKRIKLTAEREVREALIRFVNQLQAPSSLTNQQRAWCWHEKAVNAQRGSNLDQAEDFYRRAAYVDPYNLAHRCGLATCLMLLSSKRPSAMKESLGIFQDLLASGYTHPIMLFNFAQALTLAGRHQDAMHVARDLARVTPQDRDLQNLIQRIEKAMAG